MTQDRSIKVKLLPYSKVLVALVKGPVYSESTELWECLLSYESSVRDYFLRLGLEVFLDAGEGFAFLRSWEPDSLCETGPMDGDGDPDPEVGLNSRGLPRLTPRIPLSFEVTLLLVLLREALIQFDFGDSDNSRLVLRREDIHNLLLLYWKQASDEAKQLDRFDSLIRKVEDLGFLEPLANQDSFEVKRILKARVPAGLLREIKEKLEVYHAEQSL